MPHRRALVAVKPQDVIGFQTNRREKYVHLVTAPDVPSRCCGGVVDVVIELDAFRRLNWQTVCPTCADAVPGFLDYWRRYHQPIPY